ncbi:T9SS type A sorting domain-containing protein [Pseudochryseolinea flava]|nr:T9SS type A sorting domain-containing protein [Pseudochryseolinea flava]
MYIDTESTVPAGGSDQDVLQIFGSSGFHVSIKVPEIRYSNDDGTSVFEMIDEYLAFVQYTQEITFPTDDYYTVTYSEINRNAGVMNISRSVDTPFHIETAIVIDGSNPISSTPIGLTTPIFFARAGKPLSVSVASYQTESDVQLFYRLVVPKMGYKRLVDDYSLPENCTINPFTGCISWDGKYKTMTIVGDFILAVEIVSYRKDKVIGRMVRDFQVTLTDEALPADISLDSEDDNETNNVFETALGLNTISVLGESLNAKELTAEVYSELGELVSVVISNENTGSVKRQLVNISFDVNTSLQRDVPYLLNVRLGAKGNYTFYQDYTILLNTINRTLELPSAIDSLNNLVEEPEEFVPYPNPTIDFVNIERSVDKATIEVCDAKGASVEITTSTRGFSFSPSTPPGTYYLRMRRNSGEIVRFSILKY